jgi:recombination protein RecA
MSREEENRRVALESALEGIDKKFGKGTVFLLGSDTRLDVPVIRTGSLSLDTALGVGGYPRGRVVEVFGPESSGKTTLALHAIAEVQRLGGTAAFIDAEHALDITYAKKLGVDAEQLLVSQPDNGEQALDVAEMLVRSGAVELIVVDSVAALVPKAEIEGDMGDPHMGLQARLMSQALRKLTALIAKTNTVVMFINQVRQKIGVTFGNGETTTGGNALKFYASVRLDIRRTGSVTVGDEAIGNKVKIKVVKNKMAPPFRQTEVEILFGRGICQAAELIALAEASGVLTKSGAWYSFGDTRLQGREAVREALLRDPALFKAFSAQVRPPPPQATA